MAKAEQDGVIEIDGMPRRIKAGQEIPEGATVRPSEGPTQGRVRQPVETRKPTEQAQPTDQPAQPEKPDQRARGAAPENRGRDQ